MILLMITDISVYPLRYTIQYIVWITSQ